MYTNEIVIVEKIVYGQIMDVPLMMALQRVPPDRAHQTGLAAAKSSSGLPIFLIHTFLQVVTCVCVSFC